MKTIFVYCFVLALLVPVSSLAHKDLRFLPKCPGCEKSENGISIEEIPDGALGSESLKALAQSAHESFENEDEAANYFRKFIDKFNFKQIALNAYRWYGMNQSRPEIANAAANLTTMFLISHGIETVGGLSGTAYMATVSDLHPYLRSALGGLGVLITLPGLDPLCIVLYSTYVKYPEKMNRWLEKPRVFLLKGLKLTNYALGAPQGFWSKTMHDLRLKRLETRLDRAFVQTRAADAGFQIFVASLDGKPIAQLDFQDLDEKRVGLSAVKIGADLSNENRKEFARVASVFGLNIGNWATQLAKIDLEKDREQLSEMSWVRGVNAIENGFEITTNPEAFRVPKVCNAFNNVKFADR